MTTRLRQPMSRLELVYTTGDCWRLALALREHHGLPIAFFALPDKTGGQLTEDTLWCHAFNVLPDGRVLDITGVWSQEELLRAWGNSRHSIVLPTHDETMRLLGDITPTYPYERVDVSDVADELMETHGLIDYSYNTDE